MGSFKQPDLPGFKYKLDLLKPDDPDYELLENSIKVKDVSGNSIFDLNRKDEVKSLKIYRVVAAQSTSTGSSGLQKLFCFMGRKHQTLKES